MSEPKSDHQIIEEVNDVARLILGISGVGYTVPEDFKLHDPKYVNPRTRRAWGLAVEIYELITGTEVHDALQTVLEQPEPTYESVVDETMLDAGWKKLEELHDGGIHRGHLRKIIESAMAARKPR